MADLIDRQATVDRLKKERSFFTRSEQIGIGLDIARMIIEERVPSAQPEPITVDIDHELTQEEYEKLRKDVANASIMLLPSAQPGRRKKGKWAVRVIRGNWNDEERRTCSECGKTFRNLDIANYCPNCGARMEVEE